MLNVCLFVVIPVVEICYMLNVCLCVISLSHPSSRDLLYVKCLFVLSCYLIPGVEICYMLNVCLFVVIPVVEICYMLNVCLFVVVPVVEIILSGMFINFKIRKCTHTHVWRFIKGDKGERRKLKSDIFGDFMWTMTSLLM